MSTPAACNARLHALTWSKVFFSKGWSETRGRNHDTRGYNLEKFTGWWYTYPSEKYESQLGLLFPIYGKIKAMFQTTNQFMLKESTAAGRKNSHNLRSQTITDDRTEISPLKSCSATNVLEKYTCYQIPTQSLKTERVWISYQQILGKSSFICNIHVRSCKQPKMKTGPKNAITCEDETDWKWAYLVFDHFLSNLKLVLWDHSSLNVFIFHCGWNLWSWLNHHFS